MNELLPLLAALFAQYLTSTVPPADETTGIRSVKPVAVEHFQKTEEKLKENDRFWTAPFVLADLDQKTVTVWGEHTGMNGNEPLEFFVISEDSGHDYEAAMTSFAKPSDIHKAMEKIGAKAGNPVSPDDHQFWPRGDRVVAEFEWVSGEGKEPVRFPVENLVTTNAEKMSFTPWVFTGSPMLDNFEKEGEVIYGADLYSPNSIASTFNLQSTVFDLPFQGGKTQTYGTFMRNPEVMAPEAAPMLLHLRLARENEKEKVLDITVRFTGRKNPVQTTGLEKEQFPGLAELGAALDLRENEIHFIKPDFSETLSAAEASAFSRELQLMEKHLDSIRISSPVDGQLFYKAFVPDPRYRDRQSRPSQPLELHLRKSGGEKWTAVLMELDETWNANGPSTIVETRISLDKPEEFEKYLQDTENQKPVLFIHTTGELPYGTMTDWVGPVLDQFPIVFVYLDEE